MNKKQKESITKRIKEVMPFAEHVGFSERKKGTMWYNYISIVTKSKGIYSVSGFHYINGILNSVHGDVSIATVDIMMGLEIEPDDDIMDLENE